MLRRSMSGDLTHIAAGVCAMLDFDVERGESAFALLSRPLELN